MQLAAVLLHFISLLDESARSSRVHTYKFIHLVVAENNFLCRYFCRLGPAFKCCLEVSCAVGGRLFTLLWPRIISYVVIELSHILNLGTVFPF